MIAITHVASERSRSAGISPACTKLDLPDPLGPTTAVNPASPSTTLDSCAISSSRP
jgi:hypothetical protein